MQQVFDSGYFDRCQPKAEDTRDGVKLIIEVLLANSNKASAGIACPGCLLRILQ